MCGIAGFWGRGEESVGQEMIRSISYRGPDFLDVKFQDNVCLAHARLKVIDVDSRSNQPFYNADKSLAIVFNGEIYNYLTLKEELATLGKYNFHTTSDTEVLLYAFEEYGIECLQKIEGMFVFAIYDFRKKELVLARDRMGKKPLYYSLCPDSTFVFASELKAILKHPSVKKELDLEAVNQYLTFDYIPTPNSINVNVCRLEAAHYMVVKDGEIRKKSPYWKSNFDIDKTISFGEAKEKLDHLLNEAVKKRMISDVPLGVFLSGGLDSSTVAYYAQLNSTSKVNTFSIGFEDKSYDEQDYALQVAKHLGTEHHVKTLTSEKTVELIDEIFPLMDEPFADASIIPTYFLSQFTREKVTVALGGDGSDELLAGYPTFLSNKFKSPLKYFPDAMISLLLRAADLLPTSDKNISFDFKVKQYLRGFSSREDHIHQLWLGSFLPAEKAKLWTTEKFNLLKDKDGLEIIDEHFKNDIRLPFSKITNYYYQTYLLDDILYKVDRASMFNSLEVRAPFLDLQLVEFLNSLPIGFKQKGFQGKHILKDMMKGKLPDNIIFRSKKGFGIPLSDWIRKDLKVLIRDTILEKDSLFNHPYIEKLLNEHLSGKQNHRKLIWNLFVLKSVLKRMGYDL